MSADLTGAALPCAALPRTNGDGEALALLAVGRKAAAHAALRCLHGLPAPSFSRSEKISYSLSVQLPRRARHWSER